MHTILSAKIDRNPSRYMNKRWFTLTTFTMGVGGIKFMGCVGYDFWIYFLLSILEKEKKQKTKKETIPQ